MKTFGEAERQIFVETFIQFEETNGAEGLDPTKVNETAYRQESVLPFAKKNHVLMNFMDQPDQKSKHLNEKVYRGCNTAAEKYLDEKKKAAAVAAQNTKPDPDTDEQRKAAVTTKAAASTPSNAPDAMALFSPAPKLMRDNFDYKSNQDRFDAEYRQTDEVLGCGAFATVYKGVSKKDKFVAIKVPHWDRVAGKPHVRFRKAEEADTEALEEILIWKNLSHEKSPFILELLDSFVVLEKGLPTLKTVAPLAKQGTLDEYIEEFPDGTTRYGGLPEMESKIVAKQLLLAHAHMAACNICHRGIKPDNIMIYLDSTTNMLHKISVIDLGTAKLFCPQDGKRLKTICGTDFFHAPEVLSGNYGKDVDIYSCGQTLLVCHFGFYTTEDARQQKEWHRFWHLEDVYHPNCPNPFVEKILKLVEKDPEKRTKLDAALESFWRVDSQTEEQSKDFAFAAEKLLKFKGLGFLRHKYNAVLEQGTETAAMEELQRQLDAKTAELNAKTAEMDAARAELNATRAELNVKTAFVQTVKHAMQCLDDDDAGNAVADNSSLVVPAAITFDE